MLLGLALAAALEVDVVCTVVRAEGALQPPAAVNLSYHCYNPLSDCQRCLYVHVL